MEFHTNNIVTGVRGTSGVVTYAEHLSQSQVVVLSGTVEVVTKDDEAQVIEVHKGEVAIATTLPDGTVRLEVKEQGDTSSYLFSANFLDDSGEDVEEYVFGDYIIQWVDPVVEYEIRELLKKPSGDIWASEVNEFDSLSLASVREFTNDITLIEDVIHFTNLTTLDLYNNMIRDFNALSELSNLTTLNLSYTTISDISVLSELTNLTELNLLGNNISDISALRGLTNLTNLNLSGNNISDISVLSGLTNLTNLNLQNNKISDWSPVAHVSNVSGRA